MAVNGGPNPIVSGRLLEPLELPAEVRGTPRVKTRDRNQTGRKLVLYVCGRAVRV